MRATHVLQQQFRHVHRIFHMLCDDVTDAEWTRRALPHTNLLPFELWHIARVQDMIVQTIIRGVPEVIANAQWAGCGTLATPGIGVGLTLEQADTLAQGLARSDLKAYADAIHQVILAWFHTISDDDLDQVPDVVAHLASYPVYQEPAFRETGPWLFEGPPVSELLSRACIGHNRGHFGEMDVLIQQLRRPMG